ncbi:MAG: hypothetical protein M1839_003890 [Geoglossum umbratile]|nr:MAG: hypothetical protein M1839_003890 [Geoglossum umbratile]
MSLAQSPSLVLKTIRIVIILGGYALLRPYLLKLAGKFQARDHERELDPNEMSSDAVMSARSLRGQVQVPDDTDEEEGSGTGADWGRGARRRQREMIRRILEAEEKKRLKRPRIRIRTLKSIWLRCGLNSAICCVLRICKVPSRVTTRESPWLGVSPDIPWRSCIIRNHSFNGLGN